MKNIFIAVKCPMKQRCSLSMQDFLGSCIKSLFFLSFFLIPSHVFSFMKNWDFRNRQAPWRLAQSRSFCCCIYHFLPGVGRSPWGAGGSWRAPFLPAVFPQSPCRATIHRPPLPIAEDESRVRFCGGQSEQN